MSEPTYSQFTERMYSRLPEVLREADKLNEYALKRYISAIGDVEDQVESLIARFTYLSKQDRLGLDNLSDDYSYYDLDWRYFQATDSKNSAVITSEGEPAFLRTVEAYHVVPNTTLYVGAVYRTDNQDVNNTFGLRLWYYNATMELMSFKDAVTANGSSGPQWIIRNTTDNVPDEAHYVRISPYVHNTSGVESRVWVDDVYARTNYKVTNTNNLVSSDHNFILRSEDEMVEQGDFDLATEAQWEADRLRAKVEVDTEAMWGVIADVMGKPLVHADTEPSTDSLWVDSSDGNKIKFWDNRLGDLPRKNYATHRTPTSISVAVTQVPGVEFLGKTWTQVTNITPYHGVRLYLSAFDDEIADDEVMSASYEIGNPNDATISVNTDWGDTPVYTHIPAGSSLRTGALGKQANVASPGYKFTDVAMQSPYTGTFLYREIIVEKGSVVGPYFDGNTSSLTRWEGASGASASIYDGPAWAEMTIPEVLSDPRVVEVQEVVSQGSVQAAEAQARADLAAWDLGPQVNLADHALDLVPDIQSYRTWLNLDSDTAEPAYARQVVDGVIRNATYTISALMVKDTSVPDTAEVRMTVTPDTGGPTVQTFVMHNYEANRPALLSFVWNSPEQVSSAIVNIEYVADAPARGMRINDVSMTRYQPSLTQMDRDGEPTTLSVQEVASQELLEGAQPRGEGWVRYETGTDPESPMDPSEPDLASGTSFIEATWHPTRPSNTYTFSGEYFSTDPNGYADLLIWHRIEGKGWGEAMLHRISSNALGGWIKFSRNIVIPDSTTEFRVNIDVYRPDSTKTYDLRNLSLTSPEDRSWYVAGSRPFAFNALATRSLDSLSRGDLVHYTAKVMVTGDTSGGRGGVRVYGNGSQVLHETLIRSVEKNTLLQVTGSFQMTESLADLRVALYMNDPTPKHQAAYFLSDLDIVHSIHQYVEDPQNMIRNGGFEYANYLDGWELLAEREQVRENLSQDPSFESGLTPSSNNTFWKITQTASVSHTGSKSAQSEKVDANGGHRILSSYNTTRGTYEMPVTPGVTYAYSAWVMTHVVGAVGSIGLSFMDANGKYFATTRVPDTELEPGVWTQLALTATAPADAVSFWYSTATVHLPSATQNAEVGAKAWLDSVYIGEYKGSVDYFDSSFEDTALVRYTYNADTKTHIEHRKIYYTPLVGVSATPGIGYNKEDVPPRPEGLPLGSTSDLVDPMTANTEWLPWLAQFAGQNINHYSTMDDARVSMASGDNFASGTIDAISAAVATVLSNTKSVRIFPHTTDLTQIGKATQWDVSIVTRDSESPDTSVMEEAVRVRNAKPAGVTFHFHKHQSTWDAVELANPTWDIWDTRDWTGIEEAGLDR